MPEQQTFVGLLRAQFPDRHFINAAVIGYDFIDYENVFTTLLDRGMTFERAFLFFCLNDVSTVSGEVIRQTHGDVLATSRTNSLIEELNVFLRERSKLYLVLKSWLTDPRKRYFEADEANYVDGPRVEAALQPIIRLARLAEYHGIPLNVLIMPYAYQMRSEGRTRLNPQIMVSDILRRHEVAFVDLFPIFAAATTGNADMFLPDDPMHLSQQGHRLMRDYLNGLLRRDQMRLGP